MSYFTFSFPTRHFFSLHSPINRVVEKKELRHHRAALILQYSVTRLIVSNSSNLSVWYSYYGGLNWGQPFYWVQCVNWFTKYYNEPIYNVLLRYNKIWVINVGWVLTFWYSFVQPILKNSKLFYPETII